MLDLNLRFLLVAFLFLSSICFTSSTQYMSNRSWHTALGWHCYVDQTTDPVLVSQYINNSINKVWKYEKIARKRHANSTRAKLIQSFDSYDINYIHGNINMKLIHKCEESLSKGSSFQRAGPSDIFALDMKRTDFIRSYDPHLNVSGRSGLAYRISGPGSKEFECEYSEDTSKRNSTAIFTNFKDIHSVPVSLNTCSGRKFKCGDTSKWNSTTIFTDFKDIHSGPVSLNTCSGLSVGAIVGITTGVAAVVVFLTRCLYNRIYKKKIAEINSALLENTHLQLMPAQAPNGSSIRGADSSCVLASGLAGISVDKSVEFSYEELSKATQDFNHANKIGQGGFGAVYYANLRGEKVAIKKMDMQASKEFLAELKVLTHVHHLNLVHLIGYCVEGSLFLVYEYIENGNLSQYLHGSGKDPLPWSIRVQIALDSARGLEYIHEYTVSIFIHCDVKSANILIDKSFHAKVADFGLTKLTGVGSTSRLGGTFGYMSPEYVQYGEVSPKVDVYAFGVVLYELISAKQAIVRGNDSDDEPKGLVDLFDEVLSSEADREHDLIKLIDPRLGDNYPLDSVHKMAQLAKSCTREDPKQRPSMRSIVVTLMMFSSSVED